MCGHYKFRKRVLIQTGSFNSRLILGKKYGAGAPRGLQGAAQTAINVSIWYFLRLCNSQRLTRCHNYWLTRRSRQYSPSPSRFDFAKSLGSAMGC